MPRTEKYFVGPQLLGEIREAITRVAGMPDRTSVAEIPVRLQELQQPAPAALRYVSWDTTWSVTSTATITFLSATAQTATAVNVFAGVGPGEGWVARHLGTWHLAVVNLTMQPSYVGTDIQLLGHNDSGILEWYSVTQCGTATAS